MEVGVVEVAHRRFLNRSEKPHHQSRQQYRQNDHPGGHQHSPRQEVRPRCRRVIAEITPVTTDHHATGASRGLNTSRSLTMRPLMPAATVNGAILNFAEVRPFEASGI